MITFLEDISHGYKYITYENIRIADLTIAFAIVPDSSGEEII